MGVRGAQPPRETPPFFCNVVHQASYLVGTIELDVPNLNA